MNRKVKKLLITALAIFLTTAATAVIIYLPYGLGEFVHWIRIATMEKGSTTTMSSEEPLFITLWVAGLLVIVILCVAMAIIGPVFFICYRFVAFFADGRQYVFKWYICPCLFYKHQRDDYIKRTNQCNDIP